MSIAPPSQPPLQPIGTRPPDTGPSPSHATGLVVNQEVASTSSSSAVYIVRNGCFPGLNLVHIRDPFHMMNTAPWLIEPSPLGAKLISNALSISCRRLGSSLHMRNVLRCGTGISSSEATVPAFPALVTSTCGGENKDEQTRF